MPAIYTVVRSVYALARRPPRTPRAAGREIDTILKTNTSSVVIARDEQHLEEKLRVLDPDGSRRTSLGERLLLGAVDQVAAQFRAWLDAGIDYPIVDFLDSWEEEPLSLFAEAVRRA